MRYRYVHLQQADDGYGYIVADSYLSGKIDNNNAKLVEKDFSITNKRWNYKKSEWEEYAPEPTPEPPISKTEQAILDTAIGMDYLICLKELEI